MAAPDNLRTEYEQVNENFRALGDIRFRLVALVPTVGGLAAYLLARLADQHPLHPLVLAVSILGLLATLGITFYDQRNSQLYNALSSRAKALERELDLFDGQFSTRPKRTRRLLFIPMGHDPGLALIYAPVLGAWFFPAVVSAATMLGSTPAQARTRGILAAGLVTALFLGEFLRLDGVWKRLFRRDQPGEVVAILFRVEARPGKQQELLRFLEWDSKESMKRERGTLRFDVFRDPGTEHAFYVYEAYEDSAAFEVHKMHKPYKRWSSAKFRDEVVFPHVELEVVHSSGDAAPVVPEKPMRP